MHRKQATATHGNKGSLKKKPAISEARFIY
jgi:hypothetical protein